MKKTPIILAIFALLALVFLVILPLVRKDPAPGPVACTMEAKICPDGSAVGRSGPNCEFAECPAFDPNIKRGLDGSRMVSFLYPEDIGTEYITEDVWPPSLTVVPGVLVCNEKGSPEAEGGETKSVTIRGLKYCVTTLSEGAAGSVFTRYTYRTAVEDILFAFDFTLRRPQCGNFEEPKKTACEEEIASFDPNMLAHELVSSIDLEDSETEENMR